MKNHRVGFTLVELLVVISIISVLSSVVLVSIKQARIKGANAHINQQIIQLRNTFELNKIGDVYPDFPLLTVSAGGVIIGVNSFTNTVIQNIINDILTTNGGLYGGGIISSNPINNGSCTSPYYGVFSYASQNPQTGQSNSYFSNGLSIYVYPASCVPITTYAIYAEKKPISLTGTASVNMSDYAGYYCIDSSGNSISTNTGWIPSNVSDGKCH